MAGRQRTTFQKRQKEVKRREKQKMKADKRATRREERALNKGPATSEFELLQPPEETPDEPPVNHS